MHVDQIVVQQVGEAGKVAGSKPPDALAVPLERGMPGCHVRVHAASAVNADTPRVQAAMRSLTSTGASPLPNT
ncbi:hypothetical protein JCM10599A_29930 [Paraburkholderia kururiensis]